MSRQHLRPWLRVQRVGVEATGGGGLGLGGTNMNPQPPPYRQVPLPESRVLVPSDMVAIGDGSAPYDFSWEYRFSYDVNGMNPNHNEGANEVFCDGHVEYGKLFNWAKADDVHRRRWNNDHEPHPEHWHKPINP